MKTPSAAEALDGAGGEFWREEVDQNFSSGDLGGEAAAMSKRKLHTKVDGRKICEARRRATLLPPHLYPLLSASGCGS